MIAKRVIRVGIGHKEGYSVGIGRYAVEIDPKEGYSVGIDRKEGYTGRVAKRGIL